MHDLTALTRSTRSALVWLQRIGALGLVVVIALLAPGMTAVADAQTPRQHAYLPVATTGPAGHWEDGADLLVARSGHTATLLADGRVLVAGGDGVTEHPRQAELYDPARDTWQLTGALNLPRREHLAVRLEDGSVLVLGGLVSAVDDAVATAPQTVVERYDPATGAWRLRQPPLFRITTRATATLLGDGTVLVVGVREGDTVLRTQRYDPVADRWTLVPGLDLCYLAHIAAPLPDGNALVVGGYKLSGGCQPRSLPWRTASAWRYEPTRGEWSEVASPSAVFEDDHSAFPLVDGSVLAIDTARTERYHPANGRWRRAGQRMWRSRPTVAPLADGGALVLGGYCQVNRGGHPRPAYRGCREAEQYVPETNIWVPAGPNEWRILQTATLLPDGRVLVTGGFGPRVVEPGADRKWTAHAKVDLYCPRPCAR